MADSGTVLRELQLRFRVSVRARADDGEAHEGLVHLRHGFSDRTWPLRRYPARRPRVRCRRGHPRGDGEGELVGGRRRGRASERRTARCHHGDRQRCRRRTHGSAGRFGRQVPRCGVGAHRVPARRGLLVGERVKQDSADGPGSHRAESRRRSRCSCRTRGILPATRSPLRGPRTVVWRRSGVSWADASGRNNAQYAPFAWRSA